MGKGTKYQDPDGIWFDSEKAMCDFHGVNIHTYVYRKNHGYSLERCLSKDGQYQSNQNRRAEVLDKNRQARLGVVIKQKDGLAECIEYINAHNCTIRFLDDGTIRTGMDFCQFREGKVAKEKDRSKAYAKKRVGTSVIQKKDGLAECIEYINSLNITIRFLDDNTITHTKWETFVAGQARKMNRVDKKNARVGMVVFQKPDNEEAECIAYRKASDCDIRFKDGTEKDHIDFQDFVKGNVPKVKMSERSEALPGMVIKQKCGLYAKLTVYRNTHDCDYELSDDNGDIVCQLEHLNFSAFKEKRLSLRSKTQSEKKAEMQSHVGVKILQRCGLEGTCIRYGGVSDIDVQLNNGRIYRHKKWEVFERGGIGAGTSKEGIADMKKAAEGTVVISVSGLRMKCTGYRSSSDIDVMFEDGSVPDKNRIWSKFRDGLIQHNTLAAGDHYVNGTFVGYKTRKAFCIGDKHYYECVDMDTGRKSVQTPQQMMASKGVKPVF